MKQAILFLTNKKDAITTKRFKTLLKAENDNTDIYVLYNGQGNPTQYEGHVMSFDNLYNLGYVPFTDRVNCGNTHFPLMKFYRDKDFYDYYWFIEDDVIFTGEWNTLFDYYKNDMTDFVSTYVRNYAEDTGWYWWQYTYTSNDYIEKKDMAASLCPIYRISNRALKCIHEKISKGWWGHHECVIPTIIKNCNLTMKDMTEFYTPDTFSYQPLEIQPIMKEIIYHPIKQKKSSSKPRRNCVISAVGKNSLHRHWLENCKNRSFDLHLIVYDNSFNTFYDDADFLYYKKGYKLQLIYDYLKNNPEFMCYDYFFCPDEDIYMTSEDIEKLFKEMEERHLQIAQPSIANTYATYPHTKRKEGSVIRYCNFVEMMMPCFSSSAFKKVFETFNANKSGWGTEFHWHKLIDAKYKDMAILDCVPVLHTRPLQKHSKMFHKEMVEYMNKYNLTNKIEEYE